MGGWHRRHRFRVVCGAALVYKSTARHLPNALAIYERVGQVRQVEEFPAHLADLQLPADTEEATGEATGEATEARTKAVTTASTSLSTPCLCPEDFVEAINNGDVKRVEELLSEKQTADLKTCTIIFRAQNQWGQLGAVTGVALHLAAYEAQANIVQALLEQQADVNAPTIAGEYPFRPSSTALVLASKANNLEVVKILLATPGILVNHQNEEGFDALILAAWTNSTEVVNALLERGDIKVNLQDKYGFSALMRAAQEGKAEAVEMLIARRDVDVNLRNFRDGDSALSVASFSGNVEVVVEKLLARKDIDPNNQDKDGKSLLIWAADRNELQVVKALLKRKDIKVNLVPKDGRSALICAAQCGGEEVVAELLQKEELDVNFQTRDDKSSLICAAFSGHLEVVKALLKRDDIEVNLRSKEGRSALVEATRTDNDEVVQALLKDMRVDVNLADQVGDTALMTAVWHNQPEVVSCLLTRADIDVDMQNADGMTALMLAISRGSERVCNMLSPKSNASITDKDGADAAVYAADISIRWVYLLISLHFQVHYRDAFLKAARSGHRKALKTLDAFHRQHRTDWGDCGQDGSAMLWAARGGQISTAKWLLKRNTEIDIHCRDEDGNSGLVLAVTAGHYLHTKWLLDHFASVKDDIDDSKMEAKRLALWMGVVFSETRLVRPFVQSGISWIDLWQKPANCPKSDMEDACEDGRESLLAHARDGSIVHDLLDWQFNIDKTYAKTISELSMRRIGLTSDAKKEILGSLAYMLRENRSEPALALLSRTDWNWIEDLRKVKDLDLEKVRLYSDSKAVKVGNGKCWNLLHWGAFSCDVEALSIAMKFTAKDLVKLLDSKPTEGQTDTAFEIANSNQQCFRCVSIFTEIMIDWKRQRDVRFIGAHVTAMASVGAIFLFLFFLQHQSLKKRGWLLMSTVPLPLSAAGLFLVRMPAEKGEGSCSISVTSDKLKASVGWLAMVSGAALFLGVSATFAGPRPTASLLAAKKRCTDKLDRFWDKANCGLALLMLVVFLIEAAVLGEMDLAVDFSGLIVGLVHTVSATLPLFIANPRWITVPLRLAPGICFLGCIIIIAAKQQPITRLWHFFSEGGVVLIGTCLALAWADGIGMAKRGLRRVAEVIEIEMTAKQAAEGSSSSDKFIAGKLVLGHPVLAAQGLEVALGMTPERMAEGLKDPIEAMRREILSTGDQNDLENFVYIVEGISGRTSDLPSAVAESLRTGVYHGGTIEPGEFDTGHHGRTLDDWMKVPEVAKAGVSKAEFIAVRLYTSSSFPRINGPLRKEVRPHPWAMVVLQLDHGIKKLRSVQAQVNPEAFAGETTLWRGMKNLEVDVRKFASVGGTEMAPMSTTTNEDVARHYATSKVPLVFKFVVGGLKTGVSIQFLSLYPKEEEFLYSPLTFLSLKNNYEDDGTTILVVEPVMS